MKITLDPIRSDATLTLARRGDTLVIDGVAFDFSAVTGRRPLRREALGSDWILSDVTRRWGRLILTIGLPHAPGVRFPDPAALSVPVETDGPIPLPQPR